MDEKILGIFIFHNDLRLDDNVGLNEISKVCDVILPIFIFTPEQILPTNRYRSTKAIEFMLGQLSYLDTKLREKGGKLYMFYGSTSSIVSKLITNFSKRMGFKLIVANNANYTPFALDRDASVKSVCERHGCEYLLSEDYGLYPIGSFSPSTSRDSRLSADGKPSVYKKFTPFYNLAKRTLPNRPIHTSLAKLFNGNIKGTITANDMAKKMRIAKLEIEPPDVALRSIIRMKTYNHDRDKLTFSTSRLSAHIKFGTVSIRNVYWKARDLLGKGGSDFIKQLYWREFYMNIVWAFPYVLQGHNFNPNYHANWKNGKADSQLIAWCKGQTGVPIVDACMRELNTTGYMHNRGRLIVAGFLTKVLGWHWKFGELYFATKLRDYDPAQNNGNWQFVAGSGVDQQPYFRMFNPWLQSKTHDPNCVYIKHWCPEYKDFPNNILHNEVKLREYIITNGSKVVEPIVDYVKQRDLTKKRYK